MDGQDVVVMNARLLEKYGATLSGKPRFRIVWAPNQTEKRLGVFRDFSREGILIRETREVRETKKYWYIKERWLLEIYNDKTAAPEEVFDYDFYEPLFPFESAAGEYLETNLRVSILCCESIVNPEARKRKIREADVDEMKRKELEEETEYFENYLHDIGRAPIFANGSTVVLDKPVKES